MPMQDDTTAAPGAQMEHMQPPWPHFANMTLGLWLITSAFALGYRSTALQVSDVASGTLVILFAALSLSRRPFWKFWAPWANSLIGLWLLFAPLVFWAPTAAAYANDTLIGALVVVFAILAPGMPMAPRMSMEPGPEVPPGWSYNPSSWPQRAPIIALALVGFFLSRQMTAFQLGHVASLTDPFFGIGTERVLTSDVSRAFPIPDAGLGAVAYMIEFLMGFMGDKRRWRTMPWMVTFFGILVVPLGVVSITLIILQPLAVGAWCTPCLIAAAGMLVMIPLTLDEVVAMCQFLVQARREGQPFWRTFWLGGTLRDLPVTGPVRPDVVSAKAMVWGGSDALEPARERGPRRLADAHAVSAWYHRRGRPQRPSRRSADRDHGRHRIGRRGPRDALHQHPLRRLCDRGPVDPQRGHARLEVERRDRRGTGDPAEPAARTRRRALRHVGALHPVTAVWSCTNAPAGRGETPRLRTTCVCLI
jgi:uncharacterized membrane protein